MLQRRSTPVIVTNPDSFIYTGEKYLSIPDLPRARSGGYRFNCSFRHFVGNHQFHFDLGEEVYRVFAATIDLGVPFLSSVTAYFEYGHSLNSDFNQSFLYSIQLRGLYYRFDFGHGSFSVNCLKSFGDPLSGAPADDALPASTKMFAGFQNIRTRF